MPFRGGAKDEVAAEEEDDGQDTAVQSPADEEEGEDGSDHIGGEVYGEDDEFVGAVKTRTRSKGKQRKASESESEAVVDDEEDDDSDADSDKSAGEDWEAVEDEGDIGNVTASRCVFCHEDEEHDPSEEFEEYLACSVCGDNAHRQCARDEGSLAADEDAQQWRCKDCVSNNLEADFKNVPEMLSTRRRSSAPRMARDLLPAARGGIKPDSHSVFNTLILDEDPMDGSRSLRKRKTPSAEDADELARATTRKRRKSSNEADDADGVADAATPSVNGLDGTTEDPSSPRSRPSRPQRQLKRKMEARIVSRSGQPRSIVISIPITLAQWDEVERNHVKKQKRRERDRIRRARNNRQTITAEVEEPQHFPAVQTTMYTNPFYAFPDRETDETKGRPYGGILTEAEADTTRSYPQEGDRLAFQQARDRAEQQWKDKVAQMNGETSARQKSSGQPSKIKCINFGQYEIDTWHAAPYPEEYSRNKHLYVCEFCLKYMSSDYVAWRHKLKCSAKHPPGDEIYRNKVINPETGAETTLSFFEVDGRRNPLYCQNLCLLAKLFLGSKTLYYDVEPFLFYIMTENDDFGCHFVGYFSKEKRGSGPVPPANPHISLDHGQGAQANGGADVDTEEAVLDPMLSSPGNNVSCILVLPVHMRRGFGRVLIEFSYLLTKVEGRTGSPEKPLSDMGLVSYRSYWRSVLCSLLLRYQGEVDDESVKQPKISIAQIARETGMTFDDIISTLEALRFLVRDPVTRTYALRLDYDYMREYVEKHEKKATIQLDPDRLCWTPYIMGKPTNLFALGEEATQPMQTVAPRQDPNALPDEPEEGVQQALKLDQDDVSQNELPKSGGAEVPRRLPETNASSPRSRKRTPAPPTSTPQVSLPRSTQRTTTPNQAILPRTTSNTTQDPTTRSGTPTSINSTSQLPPETIPPTRFEVFPPIPGMATSSASSAKRRTAQRRPARLRGSTNYGSPARRSTPRRARSPDGGNGLTATTLRRTRSTLGDLALSAAEREVEDGGEEEEGEAEVDGLSGDEHEEEEEEEEEKKEEEEQIKYD